MYRVCKQSLLNGGAVLFCGVAGWLGGGLLGEESGEVRISKEVKRVVDVEAELLVRWQKDVEPLMVNFCFDCHGDGMDKGGLDFDAYPDLASMRADKRVWEHVLARMEYRLMPPVGKDQPSDEERARVMEWVEEVVFPVGVGDPGEMVMRRLNRVEYGNTVRDLFGLDVGVEDLLPVDDSGYGFDNVGSVLTVSPMHVRKYLEASDAILEKALVMGPMKPVREVLDPRKLATSGMVREEGVYFSTKGFVRLESEGRTKGEYRLVLDASASEAGDELAFMDVHGGDGLVKRFEVGRKEREYVATFVLGEDGGDIEVRFSNDFYDPENTNPQRRDRNLMVHRLVLEGPLGVNREKPASHRRVFVKRAKGLNDAEYAGVVLEKFGRRAFRRGLLEGEVDRYVGLAMKVAGERGSLEVGIRSAIQAMMVSPSFVFLEQRLVRGGDEIRLVDEVTLANRLSYFLWSSMPDEELFDLAARGELRKNLKGQVRRMLGDARAGELVENFVGQWLQLRDLEILRPSSKQFRKFDTRLLSDMKRETEMLAGEVFLRGGKITSLLDADYSYLNGRLARHYGISGVEGGGFQKVSLAGSGRKGILTHGSVLILTSHPTRTSPVLRGKYVLENILDITPPPPPPDLPDLEEAGGHGQVVSLRKQLELHRSKKSCAGCHSLIDPLGFAMENFDAIGRWRDLEKGLEIDASGVLVTGEKVDGVESLVKILAGAKREEFVRAVAAKMLTYALGRGVDRYDRLILDEVVRKTEADGDRAEALIFGIIESAPFQYGREVLEEKGK